MRYDSLPTVAQIIMGQSPPSSSYNSQGQGLPFFQGKVDFGDLYPKVRVFCKEPLKIAEAGDILISIRAPVGPTNITLEKSCIGRGLAALRCRKGFNTKFLLYFLRFYESEIARISTGSTFEAISRDDLENIRVPILSLSEQKRIAAILEKADRLRRLRRYALELSGTYLQTVFLEMFEDPVRNPKGWKLQLLGDLLSIPAHIGTITPAKETGEQLCVRVGEVGEWNINLSQCKYTSLSLQELKRFSLLPGDIVLARAIGSEAHLGKLSIMGRSSIPVVFDSHLMRLRADSSHLLSFFLAFWLKTDGGRTRFMREARRTAVQFNINAEQISSIAIPLPPVPLQQKFVEIITKYERVRTQQREALRQAEHLFQTLLHRAFEGELKLESEPVDMPEGQEDMHDAQSSRDGSGAFEQAVYQLSLPID